MKNKWINYPYHPIVIWTAELDLEPGYPSVELLLSYANAFMEIGTEEHIWNLLYLNYDDTHIFDSTSGQTYTQFLTEVLADTDKLPLFNYRIRRFALRDRTIYRCSSLLAHYDKQDNLVTQPVEDTGILLQTLYPELQEDYGHYMDPAVPVYIKGSTFSLPNKEKQSLTIDISIHSDIWVPWVRRNIPWSDRSLYNPDLDLYDQRELANFHTPRLNNFLKKVSQLTLDVGGKWLEYGCEGSPIKYYPMIHDFGIHLK